jgi:hypothetical protein
MKLTQLITKKIEFASIVEPHMNNELFSLPFTLQNHPFHRIWLMHLFGLLMCGIEKSYLRMCNLRNTLY